MERRNHTITSVDPIVRTSHYELLARKTSSWIWPKQSVIKCTSQTLRCPSLSQITL